MPLFLTYLVILFLTGCSGQQTRYQAGDDRDRPDRENMSFENRTLFEKWYEQQNLQCSRPYLCGLGEGSSPVQADNSARQEISKTIAVEVKGNQVLKSSASSSTQRELGKDIDYEALEEGWQKTVTESFQQQLLGTEIVSRFHDKTKDRHYSLMRLKKENLLEQVYAEIMKIDQEKKEYWEMEKRLSLTALKEKTQKRLWWSQLYSVLENGVMQAPKISVDPISFDMILGREKEWLANPVQYKLTIKIHKNSELNESCVSCLDDLSVSFSQKLKEIASRSGIIWIQGGINGQRNTVKKEIILQFYAEKQFLNVKGFESWKAKVEIQGKEINEKSVLALDENQQKEYATLWSFEDKANGRSARNSFEVLSKKISNLFETQQSSLRL